MALAARASQAEEQIVLRRRASASADDRRAAHARRAAGHGVDRRRSPNSPISTADVFGALLQYPATTARCATARRSRARARRGALVVVAADLLALTLLAPPGDWAPTSRRQLAALRRADGLRRAARGLLRVRDAFVKRSLPGRIIGVSVDAHGSRPTAWRCRRASSTSAARRRPQHLHRAGAAGGDRAMYAVYHGPEGLTRIAERVHAARMRAGTRAAALGYAAANDAFFDTLRGRRRAARDARSSRARARRGSTCATSATARSASRSTRPRRGGRRSRSVACFAWRRRWLARRGASSRARASAR
jgi:glycine cleavage system pyridoxal-binding protein P